MGNPRGYPGSPVSCGVLDRSSLSNHELVRRGGVVKEFYRRHKKRFAALNFGLFYIKLTNATYNRCIIIYIAHILFRI